MKIILKIFLILLVASFYKEIFPQDTTTSLAYKSTRPNKKALPFYQPDLAYRIWQQFSLIREANAGNAFAQHELGLRYLMGDGVVADTVAGAMWIKKAADQDLTSAVFNYGILLLNGWGVEWNPYEAFNCFLTAAKAGMPQAQHIVGLFYTDNLLVKRDYSLAYKWVKMAAENDYEPAKESLAEFRNKIPSELIDTTLTGSYSSSDDENDNSLVSSLGLVFIDFDAVSDTVREITDKMLIEGLLNPGNENIPDSLLKDVEKLEDINKEVVNKIISVAEYGSPDALTIIGRMYEKGIHFSKDDITAAAYYIRAVRLDSPAAGKLLYDLCRKENFINQVQNLSSKNDPEAMFVWYGITIPGFDIRITSNDAFNLLVKSADKGFLPAIIELGLSYYTGNIVDEDKVKAIELWQSAERLNNPEAKTRIAAGIIFGEIQSDEINEAIKTLNEMAENGSVLAQVAIAFAYENGIGLRSSKSEAVKFYRYAAQRGNRFAYNELKRIYDDIRPPEFRVN